MQMYMPSIAGFIDANDASLHYELAGSRGAHCRYALESGRAALAVEWMLDKEHVTAPESVYVAFPFALAEPSFLVGGGLFVRGGVVVNTTIANNHSNGGRDLAATSALALHNTIVSGPSDFFATACQWRSYAAVAP